jgi:glycerol-3-phosphate dehydrogenase (NAD(P)+)
LHTAKEVDELARSHQVDMPITQQVKRVLYDGEEAAAAVDALLAREPKAEIL